MVWDILLVSLGQLPQLRPFVPSQLLTLQQVLALVGSCWREGLDAVKAQLAIAETLGYQHLHAETKHTAILFVLKNVYSIPARLCTDSN